MIDKLHCIECERDFTGTPEMMVFKFTEHDCFQNDVEQRQQAMCNHPSARKGTCND